MRVSLSIEVGLLGDSIKDAEYRIFAAFDTRRRGFNGSAFVD
jgi:hypothetical protein